MSKINDVLRLKFEAKLSHRDISLCLKIGPATVSETLTRFKNAKLSWPLPDDLKYLTKSYRIFRWIIRLFDFTTSWLFCILMVVFRRF